MRRWVVTGALAVALLSVAIVMTLLQTVVVDVRPFDAHLSANRTCEIGMQHATGRPYRSVLIELERATRPDGNQRDDPTRPSTGSRP